MGRSDLQGVCSGRHLPVQIDTHVATRDCDGGSGGLDCAPQAYGNRIGTFAGHVNSGACRSRRNEIVEYASVQAFAGPPLLGGIFGDHAVFVRHRSFSLRAMAVGRRFMLLHASCQMAPASAPQESPVFGRSILGAGVRTRLRVLESERTVVPVWGDCSCICGLVAVKRRRPERHDSERRGILRSTRQEVVATRNYRPALGASVILGDTWNEKRIW